MERKFLILSQLLMLSKCIIFFFVVAWLTDWLQFEMMIASLVGLLKMGFWGVGIFKKCQINKEVKWKRNLGQTFQLLHKSAVIFSLLIVN